jgi:hypothetical protein
MNRRITVTHPMTRAAPTGRPSAQPFDISDPGGAPPDLADVVIRSLMRAQLSLALRWFALMAAALGGAVLLLVWIPRLTDEIVLGAPLSWWLVGATFFPFLCWVSWAYVRAVERLERRFRSLTEGRTGRGAEAP